jgi:hypothetical protein
MKLILENIGPVKKAEIHLKDLTVVVSENPLCSALLPKVIDAVARMVGRTPTDFWGDSLKEVLKGLQKEFLWATKPWEDGSREGRIRVHSEGSLVLELSVTCTTVLNVRPPAETTVDDIQVGVRVEEAITHSTLSCSCGVAHPYNFLHWANHRYPGSRMTVAGALIESGVHPVDQLALAKNVVETARNFVFVCVTSHSPYMVEALKRYSDREGVSARFGLVGEDGILRYDCLSDIFAGFAQPFDEFRRMDAEDMRDE